MKHDVSVPVAAMPGFIRATAAAVTARSHDANMARTAAASNGLSLPRPAAVAAIGQRDRAVHLFPHHRERKQRKPLAAELSRRVELPEP